MKILSIGNSFSADAHAYLHKLAEQRGIELKTVNLAIGGCSLEMHYNNVVNNNANYLLSINGGEWERELVTIEEYIKKERYDVVTLQQVSHFSGQYETYQPYLNYLAKYVRENQPTAHLYFHKTWAYELDSSHFGFQAYDQNQRKMYDSICNAASSACLVTGATVIPSGDVIQAMRENLPAFDYANGGQSLCCDGFHMSHTYGRFAVAMTWLATLTGKRAESLPFMELDLQIIEKICEIINQTLFEK
ncbi:MAG: DUF4886 domain-containing protein [Clostridia bacterium]|nr:DUF4886 domain-containing protein [Clostridia bacterium]